MIDPVVVQNQGDFPTWIRGEKILKKSNKGCGISLFFFPVMHLPGLIINRTEQLGSLVVTVRWHFTLSATRKPIVLQRLIGSDHQSVFKEQMINFFRFNLFLERCKGVLFEICMSVLVCVDKRIRGFGKTEVHPF